MKKWGIIFLVFVLADQLIYVKSAACTETDVKLTGQEIKLDKGAVKLTNKNQDIKVEMLKKATPCDLSFTAYKSMEMEMTVVEYSLGDDASCTNSFIKCESNDKKKLDVCTADKKGSSLKSMESMKVTLQSSKDNGFVLLKFKSAQGSECGPSEIVLTDKNQTIKFPRTTEGFTKDSECDIVVSGIQNRAFTVIVPEINLASESCTTDYITFSDKEIATVAESDKKCKSKDITGPISASSGKLYIKIVTGTATATALGKQSVTLQFQTGYPECGADEVVVSKEGTQIQLPASGFKFRSDTTCQIKVSGKDGLNFSMTLPSIKFAEGDCKSDYVSAATSPANLPNAAYMKCGNSPVNEPFQSANGVMYLQVKTTNVQNDPSVTIKFQSGAKKPGMHAFGAILFLTLFSVVIP